MSTLYGGSICLTDLIEAAKAGHSSCTRSQNGKVYVNINIWLNDTADQYGNDVSLQLNSKKEQREAEGKKYIGNAKKVQAATPVTAAPDLELNDLPF